MTIIGTKCITHLTKTRAIQSVESLHHLTFADLNDTKMVPQLYTFYYDSADNTVKYHMEALGKQCKINIVHFLL